VTADLVRVLITGFGPFPGAPFNPSALLAKALARRRRPALAGIERDVHVFATAYAAVDHDLPKLFAAKPDIVLMFGLAGRRRELCIETRARNAVSLLFPDAGGHRPPRGEISPGAPPAQGKAPFARLLHAARSARVPVRLSRDAGRYLCNYIYWRALEHAGAKGPLVQFVHIPPLGAKRRRPAKRRRMALPPMIDAAEAMLIALIAASRH
jgi:pyroglutamyl-peptidase